MVRSGAPEAIPEENISCKSQKIRILHAGLTPGKSYDLDELSFTLDIEGAGLLPRLTDRETGGVLARVAGGRYALGPSRAS